MKTRKVPTRRFGATGLPMPVFSCGGMRYQHRWGDEPPESIPREGQVNLERTIERALELGINHIETARGYGTSEMQLGWILPQLDRERLIVQTKVAPAEDPAEFLETLRKSMGYLRLEYIDLFSFHGLNTSDLLRQIVRKGGCMELVRKLQRDGVIRHVGFSTHGPTEVLMEAIETGEFAYLNLHWYWVNDFNWPAVRAASARDMGVFIISPSDKGGMLYRPPEKLRALCEPLTPMQFNDLYCLARPEVHTLSIGAARPSDFDEHVGALEWYDRAAEVVEPIDLRLREEMRRILGGDWIEGWWRGLPRQEEMPGGIHLQEILRLWGLAKGLDLIEFGKMRYNLLGNGGHWFPGSNADGVDRKVIRRALDGHPFADRIPEILVEAHELLKGEPKKRQSEESD